MNLLNTESRRPLVLSATQVRIVEGAVRIECVSAQAAGQVGFTPRICAQMALPYKDPGEVSRWERRNGDLCLVVRPATIVNPDGSTGDGYPYGVIPRYLLTWIATEAVRTQSPILRLGTSMNEFIDTVGLSKGGAGGRRLKEQLLRLLGCTIQVQKIRPDPLGGHRITGTRLTVADSFDLWLPASDDMAREKGSLWRDTITLSPDFYQSIVEAPVPVDLRAMKSLAGSPMRLDIYVWLTYRMSYLRRPSVIPWTLLAAQFGGDFARLRAFKENFLRNLRGVSVIYPDANFKVMDTGLMLCPSPTHVARADALRIDT